MKLGIHQENNSFSQRWIDYCNKNNIDWKPVDCYRSDIVFHLSDCDALMWHFNHKGPKASKFAKQLLFSLEAAGKRVFPDYNTVWHFDDKIAQKYLLESIDAPLAPAYVFYSKNEALEWAQQTTYPKVFKLRNGAGSENVRLVKNKSAAFRLIRKAFGRGFSQYNAWGNLNERIRKFRLGKTTLWDVIKGIIRLVHTTEYSRVAGREIGYIYFQDFIPDNNYDIRVVVVGDKAFAIKRLARDGDFRASGSGYIQYNKNLFNDEIIKLSLDLAKKLKTQCIAFDFVYLGSKPLLLEISYGFASEGYNPCPGYWDKNLHWHEGKFDPYGWMVDLLLTN